ncbi:MAG TPA: DUF4339 domain-containing protein [Chthoniobacteraceae bacterium]|nr:DUF4339 domain-containing protein [Chthoniobacteraceae bacterium]
MTEWYYRDSQSRKIGPLSTEQFEQRVADGAVTPRTRVWRSGLVDWTTYAALLAHEANCVAAATGPTARAAPESTSYSTLIALGASATNRPPSGSCIATPVASEHGYTAPSFEKCPDCREEIASNLFREMGRRRICGFCVHKREVKAERDRLCEAKGVDSNWVGKFFLRCAIIAGAFVLARIVLFEMQHTSESPSALPSVEDLSSPAPALTAAHSPGR